MEHEEVKASNYHENVWNMYRARTRNVSCTHNYLYGMLHTEIKFDLLCYYKLYQATICDLPPKISRKS